jgi:serine/threonine-protein kinase
MLGPGDSFGRYKIEAPLGEGGMGRVYRALDTRLHRRVALKVLHADAAGAREGAERMVREARAAAALNHPNIVQLFDAGDVDGAPFLAMELVLGRSLRAAMSEEGVSIEQRVAWLADVAVALGAAHEKGLVHRDVKPDNVMIDETGRAKVLDFGIARAAAAPSSATADTALPPITEAGAVVGTLLYMAPEQVRGEELDGRTDQFAWGVTAYEVLCGKVPWPTTDAPRAVAAIVGEKPKSLRELAPSVPEGVAAVVMRAIEKAPADRFATMRDVSSALAVGGVSSSRDVALAPTEAVPASGGDATHSPIAPRARASPMRALRWIAVAVVAVAAVAVVGTRPWRESAPPTAPSAAATTVASSAATAITDFPAPHTSSPDAAAKYREALQAIRDGSLLAPQTKLREVTRLDPGFAAADVRCVALATNDPDDARTCWLAASSHRSNLTPRDAELLDALGPAARVPPDRPESYRRLRSLSDRYPGDAELALYAGFGDDDTQNAIAMARRALEADPRFAGALWMRGNAEYDEGAHAASRATLERCLALSPGAVSCLRAAATFASVEGDCDRAEGLARQMVSLDGSERAYAWLAKALAARGQSREAVIDALSEKWSRTPAGERAVRERIDRADLATLFGDFAGAKKLLDTPLAQADGGPPATFIDEVRLGRALELAVEMDRGDEAMAIAETIRTHSAAWTTTHGGTMPWMSPPAVPMALALLARRGRLSPAERDRETDSWLAFHAVPISWSAPRARVYAADTPEEATAALEWMDAGAPWPSPGAFGAVDGASRGKALFLAGRASAAIPELRRGAGSCNGLSHPMASVRAASYLGRALESTDDATGACDAYRRVLERWGDAKPKSVTADHARARRNALACK